MVDLAIRRGIRDPLRLTLGELGAAMEGYRQEQENALRLAWMTAYLGRVERMPSPQELLDGPPSAEEVAAEAAEAAEHHRELLHAMKAGRM